MNICDLITGTKRMQKATKALREKWHQTREHWQDKTAEEFEKEYLEPLAEQLKLTLGAVNRLTEVLQSAENELSDRPTSGE